MDWQGQWERLSEGVRRGVLLAITVLLCLLAARPGVIRLLETFAGQYSFRYLYLEHALVWFGLAGAVALVAVKGIGSEGTRILAGTAIAALLLVLSGLIFFRPGAPRTAGNDAIKQELDEVANQLEAFARTNGHLPYLKGEFAKVAHLGGRMTPLKTGGNPVPYKFIFAGQTDFGVQKPPVGAQPGEIYYTIDSDDAGFTLVIITPAENVSEQLQVDPQLTLKRRVALSGKP